MARIVIELEEEIKQKLKEIAFKKKVSMKDLMNEAIKNLLKGK